MRTYPLFLVLLPAILLGGCRSRAAPEPVLIGQLTPSAGPDRQLGQHAQQGVELAVEEAAAQGKTVAGRSFKVLHPETAAEGKTAEAEVVRLITLNKVAALIAGPTASLAEAETRAAHPYGLPVIVPGTLPAPSTDRAVVVLGATPDARGAALAEYASANLKPQRVVVLVDSRSRAAATLAAAFRKTWPHRGRAAPEEVAYEPGQLTDLKERVGKADLVLIAGAMADFRKLCGMLKGTVLLYGGPDRGAAAVQKELPAGADVYLATAFCAEGLTAAGKEFARRYEEKFHEVPDLAAATAHDAARLLFDAMQRAGSTDSARVRQELEKQSTFESVTGPVTWHEHQPRRPLFVLRLHDNARTRVQTIEPKAK